MSIYNSNVDIRLLANQYTNYLDQQELTEQCKMIRYVLI